MSRERVPVEEMPRRAQWLLASFVLALALRPFRAVGDGVGDGDRDRE